MSLRPRWLKINKVVRQFILADLFVVGGWGILTPILPIFVLENIEGATLMTVVISDAIYWFVKSISQIPLSLLLDKTRGERDDFFMLILGLILAAFSAVLYLLAKTPIALYGISLLQGIAFGLYTPAWGSIFARHLDENKYALEWSLDSTGIGISYGVAALAGGLIANTLGWTSIFIILIILSFVGVFMLLLVPELRVRGGITPTEEALIQDHSLHSISK